MAITKTILFLIVSILIGCTGKPTETTVSSSVVGVLATETSMEAAVLPPVDVIMATGTGVETPVASSGEAILIEYLKDKSTASTHLRLPLGDFTDFTPLLAYKDLEFLDIDNFLLSDISGIVVLSKLEKLESLWIWASKITNIEPISVLIKLKDLNLDVANNCISGSELLPLTQLEILTFHPTSAVTIEHIAALANLRELNLFLEAEGLDISPIQQLVNLERLEIGTPDYTSYELDLKGFEKLENLKWVTLSGVIRDIRPLINLPRLETADLRFAEVSEEQLKLLRAKRSISVYDHDERGH
ncbi:hypothetical protein AGMMS49579_24440 [Spirochaetia bacterium]|nr:hypothetical protein AGMMS49579_24440 [Spirochaetia bacterium]